MSREPTDTILIKHMLTGDEQAFDQLYSRYKNTVYFYLNARCSDALMINDIFQDTWETVLRRCNDYTDSGNFKAWLLTIARSRLIDYYRKQPQRAVHLEFDENTVDDTALSDSDITLTEKLVDLKCETDQLIAFMSRLPVPQQEAFSLYAVGLSVTEIADMTGVNKETAKSRVRYARAKLLQQMQNSQ